MKKKEYILINIRGAKSFSGKLRWNLKIPTDIAAPLFQLLAYLAEQAKTKKPL